MDQCKYPSQSKWANGRLENSASNFSLMQCAAATLTFKDSSYFEFTLDFRTGEWERECCECVCFYESEWENKKFSYSPISQILFYKLRRVCVCVCVCVYVWVCVCVGLWVCEIERKRALHISWKMLIFCQISKKCSLNLKLEEDFKKWMIFLILLSTKMILKYDIKKAG